MTRLSLLAAVCGVGLTSALLMADGPQAVNDYSGGSDFKAFCASCHGESAKGDGVLAASLRKRPPDLTQFLKKNDGTFPSDQVVKAITEGHEPNGMPAWLEVFSKSHDSTGRSAARARVEAIVVYLKTIQEKP